MGAMFQLLAFFGVKSKQKILFIKIKTVGGDPTATQDLLTSVNVCYLSLSCFCLTINVFLLTICCLYKYLSNLIFTVNELYFPKTPQVFCSKKNFPALPPFQFSTFCFLSNFVFCCCFLIVRSCHCPFVFGFVLLLFCLLLPLKSFFDQRFGV